MKIEIESNLIRHILKKVYFINGTAYAGKSTMVKLLADKYDGICCGENYHDVLMDVVDPVHQPNLSYFETMSGWQEFISRTPEEYEAWIDGVSKEATELEITILLQLAAQNRRILVDTNISPSVLKQIAGYHNVAILLSPQSMSVDRFFDRDDPEKQFLYQKIQQMPDPAAAMANFRSCIARINSPERYHEFAESGWFTIVRRENSTVEDTFMQLETHFRLKEA